MTEWCEFSELPSPYNIEHKYADHSSAVFLHAARGVLPNTLYTAWRHQCQRDIWYTVERLALRERSGSVQAAWSTHHEFGDEVMVEPWGVFIEGVFGMSEIEIPLDAGRHMRLGALVLDTVDYADYRATIDSYRGATIERIVSNEK